MLVRFARFLQLAGLFIVPLGLVLGMQGKGLETETVELTLLGIGGGLFLIGTMILKQKAS